VQEGKGGNTESQNELECSRFGAEPQGWSGKHGREDPRDG